MDINSFSIFISLNLIKLFMSHRVQNEIRLSHFFHTSKSELVVLQLINLLTLSLLIAVVIVLLICDGDVLQVQLMMGVGIGPLMLFTPVGHHPILQLLEVENLPPPSIQSDQI